MNNNQYGHCFDPRRLQSKVRFVYLGDCETHCWIVHAGVPPKCNLRLMTKWTAAPVVIGLFGTHDTLVVPAMAITDVHVMRLPMARSLIRAVTADVMQLGAAETGSPCPALGELVPTLLLQSR